MFFIKAKFYVICVFARVEVAGSQCHVAWLVCSIILPRLISLSLLSSIFSSPGFSLFVTEDTERHKRWGWGRERGCRERRTGAAQSKGVWCNHIKTVVLTNGNRFRQRS